MLLIPMAGLLHSEQTQRRNGLGVGTEVARKDGLGGKEVGETAAEM